MSPCSSRDSVSLNIAIRSSSFTLSNILSEMVRTRVVEPQLSSSEWGSTDGDGVLPPDSEGDEYGDSGHKSRLSGPGDTGGGLWIFS